MKSYVDSIFSLAAANLAAWGSFFTKGVDHVKIKSLGNAN